MSYKYDEKKISQPICIRNALILCSKIQLYVLHTLCLTVLLPWQHTGFQTSAMLKAFLATVAVLLSYMQMMPHIHDPTSISICQLEFVALFNVFRAENRLNIEIKWVETDKVVTCHRNKMFYTRNPIGVFSVKLLAYHVSLVCAANWPSHLHILHIF